MEFLSALNDLFSALRRHKLLAITVFLVTFSASCAMVLLLERRYEAEALLLVGNELNEHKAGSIVDPNGVNSLARIAETDEVVSKAATKVGFGRLFPHLDEMRPKDGPVTSVLRRSMARLLPSDDMRSDDGSFISMLRASMSRLLPEHAETWPNEGILIAMLRRSMSARPEGKSDLLRIAFRHPDPVVAAEFVNAIAEALISRQTELVNSGRPILTFDAQRRQLEKDVETAASKLKEFSASVSYYSLSERRAFLLKQANEIAGSIAATRSSIARQTAEKKALTEQLTRLEPVAQSPFLANIVTSMGTKSSGGTESSATTGQGADAFRTRPPLLLVRVYQDTMAAFFKVNVDLAGASNLETSLLADMQKVNEELVALSAKEAEYNRLERELALAVAAAETYAKRTMEEQITATLVNARGPSARIAQLANTPELPATPKASLILMLGLAGAFVLASAAALLPDVLRGASQAEAASRLKLRTISGRSLR